MPTTNVFVRPHNEVFVIQSFPNKIYVKRGISQRMLGWTSNIADATQFRSISEAAEAATNEFSLKVVPTMSVIPYKKQFVIRDNTTGYYREAKSAEKEVFGLTKNLTDAQKYTSKDEAIKEAKRWVAVGIYYVDM